MLSFEPPRHFLIAGHVGNIANSSISHRLLEKLLRQFADVCRLYCFYGIQKFLDRLPADMLAGLSHPFLLELDLLIPHTRTAGTRGFQLQAVPSLDNQQASHQCRNGLIASGGIEFRNASTGP